MAIVPTSDLVARPRAKGYDGVIDNVLIRLAVTPETPIQDLTAEATPQRIDTTDASEDVKDEVGQRYSKSKLDGGAGLDYLHEKGRPDNAATRFWDSENLDVFRQVDGKRSEVQLLREVGLDHFTASYEIFAGSDGEVYYRTNAGVNRHSDDSQVIAYASSDSMQISGDYIYVGGPSGINRYRIGTWTPEVVTATAAGGGMWVLKDKVLFNINNQVYDTDDESTPVLSITSGHTPTHMLDVGPAIMVLSSDGSINFMALDAELALVNAGEQEFLPNENPIMATHTFGVIGLVTAQMTKVGGTVTRFYTANLGLGGTYALQNVQLQFQVGDFTTTQDLTAHSMLATRDSIYFVTDVEGSVSDVQVWRYFLPTGGYAKYHRFGTGGSQALYMAMLNDRLFFSVPGIPGVYSEQDTYASTGYFIGPVADFFTSDDKQWVSSELSGTVPLTGGFIDLYDSTEPALLEQPDSDSWVLAQTIGLGSDQTVTASLSGRNARWHVAKVVLRSDSTRVGSPTFKSYTFRALPAPERDVLLRIPLNVSDQIESRGRRAVQVKGRGKAMEDALRAYEGRYVLIELFRPELEIRGLIEKFESTIETISNRGSVRSVMYARIRGTRIQASSGLVITSTTKASFGQWGFALQPFSSGA